jgi:23S rRNA (adenine2503-C2)-methyltransferase
VELPEVERRTPSQDGSHKLVLRYPDGARVQAVLMPDGDRLTLCVSTQVGCGFGCTFCYTGTMGLERNLSAGEIVAQVLVARRGLGPGERITHIVYMGMGEPLSNYTATVKSLRLLTDPQAFGFSPRRITVSTVGLVSGIERLAKENLKVNLAISLHATSNEIRDRIMPVNRGFAIEELLAACRRFPLPFRQRMTFEYVLLDGVNDSVEDARRLVRLLKGIRGKINLIPFNDWEGSGFARPPLARILAFQAVLLEHGITATIRWSKGEDIGAACGQLREAVPV